MPRVMIRRWGAQGQGATLEIGGLPKDALVAVVDELRDGMVRILDVYTDMDYWAPLDIIRKNSRSTNHSDTADGLERAKMVLGSVTHSRGLRGCGEQAIAKGAK